MRWSPALCERALRCPSGINQAGQRNLNLERAVSTNISPSGYIKPKFVVLSSFNISCQERVSGTKLETTYHPLKTQTNTAYESVDGFDSIIIFKQVLSLPVWTCSYADDGKAGYLIFCPSDRLCLQWRIKRKCKRFQLLEGDKNADCSQTYTQDEVAKNTNIAV